MAPVHPASVHFPITFTMLTAGLDAVYFASTFAPTASVVASTCTYIDQHDEQISDLAQLRHSASLSSLAVFLSSRTTLLFSRCYSRRLL
jgi:hypothetical protein